MPRGIYDRSKAKKRKPVNDQNITVERADVCTVNMMLELPDGGLVLKLYTGKYVSKKMLGTVIITAAGLQVMKPDQKKKPEKVLSWSLLRNLDGIVQ